MRDLILGIADVDEVKGLVKSELKSGSDPLEIIDVMSRTLNEVGERYEKGELFLSELMMIGYMANEVTTIVKPHLPRSRQKPKGKILVGTVKGDIHDIGKNIVVMMLQADGWEVVDLGVDVPPERFVEAVSSEKPDALGLSALLTSTMEEMRTVLEALRKSGLKSKVKVVVGGRPVTKQFADEIGADGFAENSVKAIRVLSELAGGGR